MAYPAPIASRIVSGQYAELYFDQTDQQYKSRPKHGFVMVYPAVKGIRIDSTGLILDLSSIYPQRVEVEPDGTFSFEAIITNQQGITPNNGWSYRIVPSWGERVASIPVSAGSGPIDLNDYFGAPEVPGYVITKGDTGRGIAEITSQGLVATIHYDDGTTGTFALPIGDGSEGGIPDATASVKGIILLSGDLAGNANNIVIGNDKITSSKLHPDVRTSISKGETAVQPAGLTKAAVGLGLVDNTADVNKPVSSATQTALNLKVNISSLATVATTGSYADLSAKPTIPSTKADIGLGNVDNTSDASKPISTATASALSGKASTSHTHPEYVKTVNGVSPDGAGAVSIGMAWSALTGVPATFAPSAHTHDYTTLTNIPTTFTPATHNHSISAVSGLQTALDGKAAISHTHLWADITDKPTTFAPSAHTHTVSQLSDATTIGKNITLAADAAAVRTLIGAGTSNLAIGTTGTTAAAGNHVHDYATLTNIPSTFAPAAHSHVIASVTGLQAALDGKAALSHTHNTNEINGLDVALSNKANVSALATKADLVGGFIPTSQIPKRSLITAVPVASLSAMLALTVDQVQPGDVAVRLDVESSFMLIADDPTDINNWQKLSWAPGTGGSTTVQTVNGQVGDVIIGKTDVGLGNVNNTADIDKPISTLTQTALNGKAATSHTHTSANISDSTTVGRSVLMAVSAAAARSAIGAGTGSSDLVIGTTGTTAKAGNYVPTWTEITSKPTTFTPATHTHVIADITSLQGTLDLKADLWNGAIVAKPLYMSTESSNAVTIPYFMNDIAYNNLRGGATRVYVDGVLNSGLNTNTLYAPSSTAMSIPSPGVTEIVIEVDLCKTFSYGTKIGFAVNESWRARNFTLEYGTSDGSWTTAVTKTGYGAGEIVVGTSPMNMNKLRYTFSDFASVQSFRMGQIFVINYASDMGAGPFVTRDGAGSIYGDMTSVANITANRFYAAQNTPLATNELIRKDYVDNAVTTINASIAGKESTLAAGTTAQYYRGDKSWQTLNVAAVSGAAPLASPGLTGTPTAPTATAGTNTTQIATTQFVTTGLATKANTSHTHLWADITDKPTTFAPSTHSHAQTDITGLAASLTAKENAFAAGTTSQYLRGDKTFVSIDKTTVGLGNVDNTSDATLLNNSALTGVPTAPTASAGTNTVQVATTAFVTAGLATKAASSHTHAQSDITNLVADLGAKAPSASPTFTGTVSGVTKGHVGLGNVDNTSDLNKAISTATQAALDLKANKSDNQYVTSGTNLTLTMPGSPVNGQMTLFEIRATAAITVTVAAGTKLTGSLTSTLAIGSGKSGFMGFRYSTAANAWYLLSAVSEA